MDKTTINMILLSMILICLVSLTIFSLTTMFSINIIHGILGVMISMIICVLMFYMLMKPIEVN